MQEIKRIIILVYYSILVFAARVQCKMPAFRYERIIIAAIKEKKRNR
jgi:hypothetical protein